MTQWNVLCLHGTLQSLPSSAAKMLLTFKQLSSHLVRVFYLPSLSRTWFIRSESHAGPRGLGFGLPTASYISAEMGTGGEEGESIYFRTFSWQHFNRHAHQGGEDNKRCASRSTLKPTAQINNTVAPVTCWGDWEWIGLGGGVRN